MKKIIFLAICVMNITVINAQGVTQSADGKSTVLLPGAAASIDITKTDFSFGYNNLDNIVVRRNNRWLLGGSMAVKNKDGIGNLFSSGTVVPDGTVNLFGGYTWSNAILGAENTGNAGFKNYIIALLQTFEDSASAVFLSESAIIVDQSDRSAAYKSLLGEYQTFVAGGHVANTFPNNMILTDTDPSVEQYRKNVQAKLVRIFSAITEKAKDFYSFRKKAVQDRIADNRSNFYRVSMFAFGGFHATDFKRFTKLDTADFSKSFEDEHFTGGKLGIGINVAYRQWRLGVTYAYEMTNNLASLNSADYTIQHNSAVNGQSISTEDKITAYSGNYGKVEVNELNVDVIYNIKLDPKAQTHVLLNPYTRANVYSRDTSLMTNTVNIGLGAYFYKATGGFIGGIYLELPDAGNNTEKKKPFSDQHRLPPLKRLSFGIVAKISLKSLLNF